MKVKVDASNTNEKITGFGIVGDSLFIKEGSMDTMKVAIPSEHLTSRKVNPLMF